MTLFKKQNMGKISIALLLFSVIIVIFFSSVNSNYNKLSKLQLQQRRNNDHNFVNVNTNATTEPTTTVTAAGTGTGRLYLTVKWYAEGMAGWRVSVTETLTLAKALNAIWVEPCVGNKHDGQLGECDDVHFKVPLSKVYRLDKLKEYYPNIISHQEYRRKIIIDSGNKSKKKIRYQKTCHVKNETLFSFDMAPYCIAKGLPNGWRNTSISIPFLEDVVISSSTVSKTTTTRGDFISVLEFIGYWKWGFEHVKKLRYYNDDDAHDHLLPVGTNETNGTTIVPIDLHRKTIKQIEMKIFQFHPTIYKLVDDILEEGGIVGDDYSVIQWRGEIHTMNYTTCAKHLVEARDIILRRDLLQEQEPPPAAIGTESVLEATTDDQTTSFANNNTSTTSNTNETTTKTTTTTTSRRTNNNLKNQNQQQKHPFFLISSLNRNENVVWDTKSKGSDAQNALQYLMEENHFLKIDTLLPPKPKLRFPNSNSSSSKQHFMIHQDPIFLVAIDLILAQKAKRFVTCSKSCSDDSICSQCGHRGNFAELAIASRKLSNMSDSVKCWPERAAGVEEGG